MLWETVETIYNIYIWEYKRTVSIINEGTSSSLYKQKQEVPFYFQMSSSGHQKDFILNFGGNCTFWRTIFICMGIKLTKRSRLILQGIENQLQCALIMNVSSDAVFVWFHLIFLFSFLCCLVCSVLFSHFFLDFSALKRICTKV